MVISEIARTGVGIVGNVMPVGLFICFVPTFHKIIQKRSVEEHEPNLCMVAPFYCMCWTFYCMCWAFYGMPFVQPDRILVATGYGVGLVSALIYLAIFMAYSYKEERKMISLHVIAQVLFMALLAVITVTNHDGPRRVFLVANVCYISTIIKCGLCCFASITICMSKSAQHVPFALSVFNFLNDCVWVAYASINKLDTYLLLSNGAGAFFGLVLLVCYACYGGNNLNN